MENQPLVTVVVMTYNSALTIIETLDSIKAQTYQNIEVIVTDDCSSDITFEKSKKWIDENKLRFAYAEIVTTDKNTGVAPNLNRGISHSHGKWIKTIAGDDILLETCIEDNIRYVLDQKDIEVLFSLVKGFNSKHLIEGSELVDNDSLNFYKKTVKEQYEYLVRKPTPKNLAPSVFFKAEIIKSHPYNELIPFQEDYPQWMELTRCGIKLYLMDKITVLYRYGDSLSNSYSRFYNPRFVESQILHFYLIRKKELEERGEIDIIKKELIFFSTFFFTIVFLRNKRNFATKLIRRFYSSIISIMR